VTPAALSMAQALVLYDRISRDRQSALLRELMLHDLFALLVVGCRRRDLIHPWIYERVREVEASPDGHLDLWARGHGKSSIITFGATLRDVLRDPELTVGIFSHTRPVAKAFLKQLKTELETNELLKDLFPDVLWRDPEREAPTWGLDSGITVKRLGNPKESTVEAWGLVDGQPTSRHYGLMVYDDVVTRESVTTPEQIATTTAAWELSRNLAGRPERTRYIGTRYHANDTYRTMIDRRAARPRVHKATVDGACDGEPVFLTRAENEAKRREMGPYTYACQMLQNPLADSAQGFLRDWLEYYDGALKTAGMNLYILVDPASKRKVGSDYTVMAVIGLGADRNYYLVDLVRDRLNLTARGETLFGLMAKYPQAIRVGYEEYGLQADIEFIRYLQNERNNRFSIVPLGGPMPKPDRIRRLVPACEQGRFWLPRRLLYVDWEKRVHDLVADFLSDEYEAFPVSLHDDMLDAISRVLDPDLRATWPAAGKVERSGGLTNWPSMTASQYKVL
jgi:phage terminase large subunit-like protein